MSEALLSVKNLSVEYRSRSGPPVSAVKEVSLELQAAEFLGIVGESGCGKTTLARAILGLVPASSAQICWRGRRLDGLTKGQARATRREMQIVFQNPFASLNPRMRTGASIAEPLEYAEADLPTAEIHRRVRQVAARVGLDPQLLTRYPHELSGGQCQRVAIARAIVANPRLLICDEALSALDVTLQAQIVQLLRELRDELGLSLLFITHSPGIVRALCSHVLVMQSGRVVERGVVKQLLESPEHPCTRALLAAPAGFAAAFRSGR